MFALQKHLRVFATCLLSFAKVERVGLKFKPLNSFVQILRTDNVLHLRELADANGCFTVSITPPAGSQLLYTARVDEYSEFP